MAVVFDAPDLVDDDLYPQLRRSLSGLGDGLDRHGFEPLRQATFAGERGESGRRAVLLFECAVAERPAIKRHEGPPVHVRDHAEDFYAAYADDPSVYGPFIDGDRYVVERERTFRTPGELLESDAIFDVRLGVAVADALDEGYEVLVGDEVATLADEFGTALAEYFDPTP